jgi:hypothetical protein
MTKSSPRRRSRSRPTFLLVAAIAVGALMTLLGAITLLSGSGVTRAAIEISGQPRLRVDRQAIDFGDVPLGRSIEAAFVLTNVGDQPLHLTQVPYVEVVEGC